MSRLHRPLGRNLVEETGLRLVEHAHELQGRTGVHARCGHCHGTGVVTSWAETPPAPTATSETTPLVKDDDSEGEVDHGQADVASEEPSDL